MKATELMIGNWVNFTYKYKGEYLTRPVRVTNIKTDYALTDDKGLPLQLHYNNGSMIGIPLTPEILEKVGFKQWGDGPKYYFLNQFRYSTERGFVSIIRPCDKAGESQQHTCGFPIMTDKIPCKHLHQLQNLYHALTGEELTYNP